MPTASKPRYGVQPSTNQATTHIMGGALLCAASPTRARGKGFTVSKPATGRFLVTINGGMGRIVAAVGFLRKATGSATFLAGPTYSSTDDAVEFRVENASGTNTDPATTAEIDFILFCTWDKEPIS